MGTSSGDGNTTKTITIAGTTGTSGGKIVFDSGGAAHIGDASSPAVADVDLNAYDSITAAGVTGNGTLTIDTSAFLFNSNEYISKITGSSTSKNIITAKNVHNISGGANDDTVTLSGNSTSFSLGAGNDHLTLNGVVSGGGDMGEGNNIITINDGGTISAGSITMGAGNDTITVNANGSGGIDEQCQITMGAGNNTLTVSGANLNLAKVKLTTGEKLTIDYQESTGGNVAAATGELMLLAGAEVTLKGMGNFSTSTVTGSSGSDSLIIESGTTLTGVVKGGKASDSLQINTTGITLGFDSGDSATISGAFSGGTNSITGADRVSGLTSTSGIKFDIGAYTGSGGGTAAENIWKDASVNTTASGSVTVGDNEYALVRGTGSGADFTISDSGNDYILLYDSNSATGTTTVEAVALVGITTAITAVHAGADGNLTLSFT